VIHYDPEQDEPAGTIGFDVFSNSAIGIDEVAVSPAGQPTEPPTAEPTAPSTGVDLAVTGLTLRGVRRGSVIADLTVDIANQGDADAPATTLVVYDQAQPDVRVQVTVEPLAAGSARSIQVSLEGPDDWANTARDFIALIDPDNSLGEADSGNNRFTASGIVLNIGAPQQPNPPTPGSNPPANVPSTDPLPIVLGALGLLAVAAAGGTGLVLRNQTTIRDRKQLQKQAQQGQPPDHCTPPGRYVEVETELDLKLLKVSEVHIDLFEPRSRNTIRTETIKDKVPADLNAAIRGVWLREPDQRLDERMSVLTKGLSRAIEQAAYREKEVLDVRVTAHLEGLELTSTFTLYNCRKQGADGVWKKAGSWEVKKTQQRDDTLFGLEQLDTQATSMAMRLEALITPLLEEYMKRF
jgi:CARDB